MLTACAGQDKTPEYTTAITDAHEIVTSAATTSSDVTTISKDLSDPYGDGGVHTQAVTDVELIDTVIKEETSSGQTAPETDAPAETVQEAPADKPAATPLAASNMEQSGDVTVTVTRMGGWNDGKSDFAQFDVVVKNKGKKDVSGWTVTIPSGSAVIDQSWNTTISCEGGTITAGPVDFNTAIYAGQDASFGMIVRDPDAINVSGASVVCAFGTIVQNWGGSSGNTVQSSPAKDVPPPTTDDWLHVKGNRIVDSKGKEVWLTGINWFGYNTGTNTFDGLWASDLNTSIAAIADHGFNLIRIPFSAELINKWAAGEYPDANYNHAYNSYLNDMTSLEIFDYVVGQCRANGLKIMIDIHSARTDTMGHMKNMWYDGDVSDKDYRAALAWMAKRYKDDDTIIAFDLKNEPHGKPNESPRAKWDGSKDKDNWRYQAELAAKAVLDQDPNVLIMVEGIEIYPRDTKANGDFSSTDPGDYTSTWWGANLRGVKDHPVDLGKYKDKLVYSPHDYGPAVYQQEWFKGDYTFESLKKDAWNDNWLYIHDSGTAPLLIGEWGGFMTQPNLKWMEMLRRLIKEERLSHTFWCFNANSGDTGGLVKDDFVTWDEEKYEFVKDVLWQENGKFVGLDHQIPLGENGKTLG
ncbi:MAG: cellulase family glycosylhydrolase [Oscillospiraceae bacterium]|nr:cellulase family glycosylhydrolase [Oscillospiraceae bacterium]